MLNPRKRLNTPRHVTSDFIFSSSEKNGATKSQDGSVFTVQLDRPVQVPLHAVNCKLEFLSGWVWNTVPNITEQNNHFRIQTTGSPVEDSAVDLGYNPALEFSVTALGEVHMWSPQPFPLNIWKVGDIFRIDGDPTIYTVTTFEYDAEDALNAPGGITSFYIAPPPPSPIGDFYNIPRIGEPTTVSMIYRTRSVFVWDIYIPQGTYELGRLNQVLQDSLLGAGLLENAIEFELNPDNGKMSTLLYTGTELDLTVTASPAEILGLQKQIYSIPIIPDPPNPYAVAESQPAFNVVNQFHIHCDLVDRGIGVNSRHTDVVGVVPITENNSIGYLVAYEPNTPTVTNIKQLRGTIRRDVRCWLTNEKDEFLNTGGEDWSFHIRLSYLIPPLQHPQHR